MNILKRDVYLLGAIIISIVCISTLHINTPSDDDHVHLILMQTYFIPILIGALQFGVKGGLGSAIVVSAVFTPHIMFQWVGDFGHNLLGFLQILLFNIIGYLTGLKAQKEKNEKMRYRQIATELEMSLKKLNDQANELSELEEQLRLSDRLAIVGELTASMAHELRNPLGTIRGTVEILNDELPADAKQNEFFRILISETERMSNVVENYLNFARNQQKSATSYSIAEVVHNSCLILASRARREQIRIIEKLPDSPVILMGNPNDLRQILINLMLNAIEAMHSPGEIAIQGMVNADKEEGNSRRRTFQLSVQDQGEGISGETINEIFKPFFTTKTKGTGLGLSIVKRIAEQNHWQIGINNIPGQGTEFIISIPLEPDTVVSKDRTETVN